MKHAIICIFCINIFIFPVNGEIREFHNLDTTITETWEWQAPRDNYNWHVTNSVCTLSAQQTFSILSFNRVFHGDPQWNILDTDGTPNTFSGYWYGLKENDNNRYNPRTDFEILYQNKRYASLESDSSDILYGPGEIIAITTFSRSISVHDATYVDLRLKVENYNSRLSYQILTSDSVNSDKFSVSLDNDGDRVAVGYKSDNSNSIVRVYEFDGSDWQQLGSDIE